ncbi:helix-turn-helix domain-containing protein [Lactobacillus mulieris]|uniref:Helix-turn-helix domain-containing protein n=1 Tax=Lactobacillus mulieris TaxID=2508708 RepID=A0AAW5WWM3_9LACO|nr:helix-turn-helix transcriptional regulator [Lactobacillus mulieris]MCZ3621998.1 helix-turn-helix domain-containing protein [Lactobacillus mulieris]MCZ3623695.1 helix-turn-helix domain-containing protein [Lactobacillus mulieris]MCZ3636005.1 helix-turn-helix domain-containing protein [Lactobacillus mulieris]MCZ3689735.1 helix-turn-helix domain-containing protein [Lactobacillus mulieris]MCZ3695738.1 helix-turn-helix domain-containing protein [Lactobacillus mulieris]
MQIGSLLKEYRLSQGKRQKEFVGEVVSQSYYSKVEKNANRITAEDLIDLLNYNNIPLWEFFSRLNHGSRLHKQEIDDLDTVMIEAYYAADKEKLANVINLIDESNLSEKDKQQQKLIARGWLESTKKPDEPNDNELRQKLKEQVFSSPNFNKNNMALYCNFMDFYDLKSNIAISKQIIKQYQSDTDIDVQRVLLSIIANMLILTIENKKPDLAKFFAKVASKISTNPAIFFYKCCIYFFENANMYQITRDKKYLIKCDNAVTVFKELGMEAYGNGLNEFIKRQLSNYPSL